MRLYVAVLVLALIAPAAAQQKPGLPSPAAATTGKGVIRGVVNAADTGRPIHRATIRLQGGDGPPFESRTAASDENGRYEVTGLKAGRYTLSVSKPGYLTLAYGQIRARESGRPLTLSESVPLDKVDFALPRASVIVARVIDQFGDPVRNVVVRPYLQRFMNGRRRLSQAGGPISSVTDDRGETRIFGLAPGEYYLAATPDFQTTWRGEIETLYPGTLDVSQARMVKVGVGDEVFATFPILRSRLSTLSGRIVGSDGGPLAAPRVSLAHPQLSSGSSRRMNVAPDGSFHEPNLAPGEWVITVDEPEYASERVQLLGDDVLGLIVTTRKGAAVRGRVTFEGGPPPKEGFDLGVAFSGEPPLMSLQAGSIRSGGRVGSIPVSPETDWAFEAQVSGTGVIRARTANWLLKAVRLDGEDVTDTVLDFGAAYSGKPVEVVLTQRRGEVSGVVVNDRGQPVMDYVVVLFPADEAQWTQVSRFFAVGRPDQQGSFRIGNLPPARYLAAAVEYLEGGEERNPETLSRLRRDATEIEVSEGQSRSLTLRLPR
jgi:hypothetical protein